MADPLTGPAGPSGQGPDETTVTYAAPALTVAAVAAGAAVAGIAAGLADPRGRFLLGLAAAALAATALVGGLIRPVVRIGPDGVDAVRWLRRIHIPWPEVGHVHAEESRRLVVTRWLEIETVPDDLLVTVPGWRLGTAPDEVAAAIERARPRPAHGH